MKFSEIKKIFEANLASGNAKLSGHAKTLLGPRTHGSVTNIGLFEAGVADDHEFELEAENGTVMAGCEAYTAILPIVSKDGAVPLSSLSADDLAKVVERDGVHGKELFLPDQNVLFGEHHWAKLKSERPNSIVTVIIGEFEGEKAIFTWHPGFPLVPGVNRSNPYTAVKLV